MFIVKSSLLVMTLSDKAIGYGSKQNWHDSHTVTHTVAPKKTRHEREKEHQCDERSPSAIKYDSDDGRELRK